MSFHSTTKPSGDLLWFNGTLVNIRLSAQSGADRINVMEHWLPFGDSPPLHIHRNEDEVFHLLEGTMRFRVYGMDIVAHAGQTLMAPKTLVMGFHPSTGFSDSEYRRVDGFLKYADQKLASSHQGPVVYITLKDVVAAYTP